MEPGSTDRELEQPLRGWIFIRGRLLRQPHLLAGGPVPVDWSHCRAWPPRRARPPCAVRGRRHAVCRRCDGMGLSAPAIPISVFFLRYPAETTDLRAIATLWRVRCVDRRLL